MPKAFRKYSSNDSLIASVQHNYRICAVLQKLCQYVWTVFLLAGTVVAGSGCADGTIHRVQNLEYGQSVFVDATQRAVINTSLTEDAWQAPGRVKPRRIICAEPSPDVGTAAARSFGAALEASVKNAWGGAGRLDTSTAQALIKLAERSVTIQYLRDGLYQACQAYANGAITSTTYSLILGHIDETLATTMMAEAAAGTVREVNAAVGAGATSSGHMPSSAVSGTADVGQAAAQAADSGKSGGAPERSSTVPARTSQAAIVPLPQITANTVTPNADVATEIARMHAAFINDASIESLMLACVSALDRPQEVPSATRLVPSETRLSKICDKFVDPGWLHKFAEASERRVLALAALDLVSKQAQALEAAARVCAPGGDRQACKALQMALPLRR